MSEKTTQETIGKLIEAGQQRDAIHIAVYPVVAIEKLFPGQEVSINTDGKVSAPTMAIRHGIIDPFLSGPVYPDQRCWLFLFPNTVTGMRHHWEHPAFVEFESSDAGRADAERWLRDLAEEYGLEFETMIDQAQDCGHLRLECGYEAHGFEGKTDAFWQNLAIYTGRFFGPSHIEGLTFSCAC